MSFITFYVGTPVLEHRTVTVIDTAHGGNGNGRIDPNETADLAVDIRNVGMGHGYNCHAILRSTDARLQTTDSTVVYGMVRKGDSATSGTDFFTVRADAGIPPETSIDCTLDLYADGGYTVSEPLTVVIGEFRNIDPIPDGPRLPPVYYAYDDVDTSYIPHPTYDWIEISGTGTRISYSQNDAVVMVSLPPAFGPFNFYGHRYTQLSISADGWICPGNYTTGNYSNTPLPNASTPPGMLCLNWDDLYPVSGSGGAGHVYYYHDMANHRFIVEYDSVRYYSGTIRDKFQVIIYDTTHTTYTGDNAFTVQYMTANGYSSTTLGIEDPARAVAIQALYNGTYHRGCAPVAPGRAIKYTTDPPGPVGIAQPSNPGPLDPSDPLRVAPNPFNGTAQVHWSLARDADVSLRVFDATGRAVRTLVTGPVTAGTRTTTWNGRDDAGRQLAHGIYFTVLETPGETAKIKVVKTR